MHYKILLNGLENKNSTYENTDISWVVVIWLTRKCQNNLLSIRSLKYFMSSTLMFFVRSLSS